MEEILQAVIKSIEDKKGMDIAVLNLAEVASFTDYFIICTGTSSRHIRALADNVQDKLGELSIRPTHIEGYKFAEWILMDYVDFVVHMFSEQARMFYELERLWQDSKRIEVKDLFKKRRRKVGRSGKMES